MMMKSGQMVLLLDGGYRGPYDLFVRDSRLRGCWYHGQYLVDWIGSDGLGLYGPDPGLPFPPLPALVAVHAGVQSRGARGRGGAPLRLAQVQWGRRLLLLLLLLLRCSRGPPARPRS
jgi:hypothetical protein